MHCRGFRPDTVQQQPSRSEPIDADHGHKLKEHKFGRKSRALRAISDTLETPQTGSPASSVASQTTSKSLPLNFVPVAPIIADGFTFPVVAASDNQLSTLDAILNASQHFRKLNGLEYETARWCGMERYPQEAGGFEGWLRQRNDFPSYQHAFSTLASAFRNQRRNGFCDREFNVLVEARNRRDVALLHVVTEDDLDYLSSECLCIHPDPLDSAAAAHYVRDGYELGFTGNQYIGVISSKMWKRIPARTQKTVLVEQCTKPEM